MSELNTTTPELDAQALADAALAESAAAATPAPAAPAAAAAAAPAADEEQGLDDWAAALAEQNEQPVVAGATGAGVFQPLSKAAASSTHNDIEMILDIPVKMTVELGRTKIAIRNLLQLAQGSVVELDGLAGEPMDVLVNGCLLAQGEVVVVNDKFGIRLTDIITPAERIRKLNR
ncbi:flagellar motor switch protein FliN [Burkholderia sp. SIMBA_043]|uniref:flagellar motor switch protein FliN n=1 Tax=Burkholderia TaxID=32008 RepID=UPI0005D7D4FE|nr:flagellar motor switch protein FliN [Burkholderia vietnamiensis]AJY06844.1 flagellar motor switch protein FliN [Burkholderia vietnamiensis LMG 10929]AVR16019.1 flagellar motor switch protein FliN [Burkholderia vietnamiensis]KVM57695.1 flagellar motor switch protein FliN [Burkholderia vietnamiensis]KVS01912.1 flagellar motor switch protein FliN [Burkholderia vietnamiensis]KVS30867.1 flagellar motor switch protein FliN [Burkholderia vietnamiensis]